ACNGACAACPTANATAFGCSGTSCVAAACNAGFHVCGGACVSNAATASCGAMCTACPTTANGAATCNGVSCGLSCAGGYLLCGGVCAACHVCSGQCVSRSLVGSCGTLCSPCPAPPANAAGTCDGTTCGFACNSGYVRCGGGCCQDCRLASGVCGGFDWCLDATGLCAPVQKLQPDPTNLPTASNFGTAVAMSGGNLAAIGSPGDDGGNTGIGSVYVFDRQ